MPQTVWFVASIFATGAFWYFLNNDQFGWTVASGVGALVFAGLAIYLHKRRSASLDLSVHREKLASFITEAQQLRTRLNETPLPVADHNAWVDRVAAYLRANLGEAYVVRLSDFSGMTFYSSSSERSKMERAIEGRSRRLQEFMAELK
jgi:hypothetical protein